MSRWRKGDLRKGGRSVLQCEWERDWVEVFVIYSTTTIGQLLSILSFPQMQFIHFSMKKTLGSRTPAFTLLCCWFGVFTRYLLSIIPRWVGLNYICSTLSLPLYILSSVGVIKVCALPYCCFLHAVKLIIFLCFSFLLYVCSMDVRLYRQPKERGLR